MSDKTSSNQDVRLAADLAADRKAYDIVVLLLADVSSVADYFVICTVTSKTQMQAVCERVEQGLREREGRIPIAREGLENGQWALLDYGDFVVHVFQPQVRELYDLERLWSQAPRWTYEPGSAIEIELA